MHKNKYNILNWSGIMASRNQFGKKFSESLDLPKEVVLDVPNIKIKGDSEVFIENHKGIIEYSKDILRLNSVLGIIKINGDNLQIKEINQEDMLILGNIFLIEIIK
jgi:sporulation protein YqfC